MTRSITVFYQKHFSKNKKFAKQIHHLIGFWPANLHLFRTALTHRSVNSQPHKNNERLEFVGDAILDCVVAEYLFELYPNHDEGFLTQMRSKMVNRKKLHHAALQLGIDQLLHHELQGRINVESNAALGDAMEAIIGAIFLDTNYNKARHFVVNQCIKPMMNMQQLEDEEISPKNKILSWASKHKHHLQFELLKEDISKNTRTFLMGINLNGEIISQSKALNKKDAEQQAAAEAIKTLGI